MGLSARRHDSDECVEVALDNGLECLGSGTVAQAVREHLMPGDILGLQRDQPGDGIVPTLSSGPSVPLPTVPDLGGGCTASRRAISGLSFGRC
jgi:hypothetical protein